MINDNKDDWRSNRKIVGYETRMIHHPLSLGNYLTGVGLKELEKKNFAEEMFVVCQEKFERTKNELKYIPFLPSGFQIGWKNILFCSHPIVCSNEVLTLKDYFEIKAIFNFNLFPFFQEENEKEEEKFNRIITIKKDDVFPQIRFIDSDLKINSTIKEKKIQTFHIPIVRNGVPSVNQLDIFLRKMKDCKDEKMVFCSYGNNIDVCYLMLFLYLYHIEKITDEDELFKIIDYENRNFGLHMEKYIENTLKKAEKDQLENIFKITLPELRDQLNYFLKKDYKPLVDKKIEVVKPYLFDNKKGKIRFKMIEKVDFIVKKNYFEDIVKSILKRCFPTISSVIKEFKLYEENYHHNLYFVELFKVYKELLKESEEYQKKANFISVSNDKLSQSIKGYFDSNYEKFFHQKNEWILLKGIINVKKELADQMEDLIKTIENFYNEQESYVREKTISLRLSDSNDEDKNKNVLSLSESFENDKINQKIVKEFEKKSKITDDINFLCDKMKGLIDDILRSKKEKKKIMNAKKRFQKKGLKLNINFKPKRVNSMKEDGVFSPKSPIYNPKSPIFSPKSPKKEKYDLNKIMKDMQNNYITKKPNKATKNNKEKTKKISLKEISKDSTSSSSNSNSKKNKKIKKKKSNNKKKSKKLLSGGSKKRNSSPVIALKKKKKTDKKKRKFVQKK